MPVAAATLVAITGEAINPMGAAAAKPFLTASDRDHLSHLDEFVSDLNTQHDGGEQRNEPRQQRAIGRVADAQPHDYGAAAAATEPIHEILVLGHNDGLMARRVVPDVAVLGMAQARIFEVLGLVARLGQCARQPGRQLGVNEEPHERQAARTME